jgi:hypothetical protein
MPAKPNSRNWNDVQTAIATAAIVSTLGLWNMFATPSKTETVKSSEPLLPPATEPPVEAEAASIPTAMPQVKIMFTQDPAQTTVLPPAQNNNHQTQNKNNKKKDNNNGSGSVTVTQTRTS